MTTEKPRTTDEIISDFKNIVKDGNLDSIEFSTCSCRCLKCLERVWFWC